MNRTLKWKIAMLTLMLVFAGAVMLPSVYKDAPEWWKKYLAPEGLRLGKTVLAGGTVEYEEHLLDGALP